VCSLWASALLESARSRRVSGLTARRLSHGRLIQLGLRCRRPISRSASNASSSCSSDIAVTAVAVRRTLCPFGHAPEVCPPGEGGPPHASSSWQQRTNLWRKVTSPPVLFSDTVTVIDTTTNTVIGNINVGHVPEYPVILSAMSMSSSQTHDVTSGQTETDDIVLARAVKRPPRLSPANDEISARCHRLASA